MKNISKLFLEEKQNLDIEAQQKEDKKKEEEEKKKEEEIKKKEEDKKKKEDEKKKEEEKFEKALISIMSEGAKEFKEKTGRNMSYSEMREMYG